MKSLRFFVLLTTIVVLHFDLCFCMKKRGRDIPGKIGEKIDVGRAYLGAVAKPAAEEKAKEAKKYFRETVKPAVAKKAGVAKKKAGEIARLVKEKVEDIPYVRKLTDIDKRREMRKQAVYKIYAKRLVMEAQEDLRKGLDKSKESNDAESLKPILDEMVKIGREIKFAEILGRKRDQDTTEEEQTKKNKQEAVEYLKSIGVKHDEIDAKFELLTQELAARLQKEEELIKREEKKDSIVTKFKNLFRFLKPKAEKKQDLELSRLYARKKFEKARSALRTAGIKEEAIDKEIDDLRKESLFEVASIEYSGEAGAIEYKPKRGREVLQKLDVTKEEAESISDLSMGHLRLRAEGEKLGKMEKFFDIVLGTSGKALRSEELMKGEVKRGIVTSTKEKAQKTGKVFKGVVVDPLAKAVKSKAEKYTE